MRWICLFLAVISVAAQDTGDRPTWLSRGFQAFNADRFEEAAEAFQKAIDLNPKDVNAHLYLGSVCVAQFVPGSESPANLELGRKAQSEFQRALQLEPNNKAALSSLASLTFEHAKGTMDPEQKLHRLDEADAWYEKLLQVDGRNKDALFSRGVIVWAKWYAAWLRAREDSGMKSEDPGPLRDQNLRIQLRSQFSSLLEQGIAYLEQALAIDPAYDDAMAYMNLLVRERADLRDTAEEYQRDVAEGDRWVQKALDTKRTKALAAMAASTPNASNAPVQRIAVDAQTQQRNRIKYVTPQYPLVARQARIQGTVRFTAIIGTDGRVQQLSLISGHPLLVQAARDAVSKWEYQPSVLNGQPVEVVTPIEVNFSIVVY